MSGESRLCDVGLLEDRRLNLILRRVLSQSRSNVVAHVTTFCQMTATMRDNLITSLALPVL